MTFRTLNLFKKKADQDSLADQFLDTAVLFRGVPYKWGKENFNEVDCSGLFSATLFLLGYPIRETAEGFRDKFFKETEVKNFEDGKVKAMFFIAKGNYNSPGGERKGDRARHIALIVGKDVVFDATVPKAKFETFKDIQERYQEENTYFEIKELYFDKVKANKVKYEFDPELG